MIQLREIKVDASEKNGIGVSKMSPGLLLLVINLKIQFDFLNSA